MSSASIVRYYARVDAQDVDGILQCFAEYAVYHRPGYPPLQGHEQIKHFYANERVIGQGQHDVTSVVEDGDRVAIEGTFAGQLRDGSSVSLLWADFWRVRPDGIATERRTYFYSPLV